MSDIHGCYDKLVEVLEIANYNNQEDQLVILGDLCDRGDQNVKTIQYAMKLQEEGAVVIMGNHDELAFGTLAEMQSGAFGWGTRSHLQCNGRNTYHEFEELDNKSIVDIYRFYLNMKSYYEHNQYLFVHAGFDTQKRLEENLSESLLWAREEFYEQPGYDDKIVVFGHTPTCYMTGIPRNKPQEIWFDNIWNDKIGIDCGCVFFGRLGCLEIDLETGEYNTYYTE